MIRTAVPRPLFDRRLCGKNLLTSPHHLHPADVESRVVTPRIRRDVEGVFQPPAGGGRRYAHPQLPAGYELPEELTGLPGQGGARRVPVVGQGPPERALVLRYVLWNW